MSDWSAVEIVEDLGRDMRFGFRQLLASPSFAIAAIATLAIGIAATAAVFSAVEAVVLRPFPFADPDRVVNVHPARLGTPVATSSNLEFATWGALPHVFQAVAATTPPAAFTLTRGHAPEVVLGSRATSALTQVLGVTPEVGRGFTSLEDQAGAPRVVILSHALWVRDYNADRDIAGRQIQIDNESYSVVGVMPAALDPVSNGTEFWVPLGLTSTDLLDFKARTLQVIARLAPGVTQSVAAASVDASEQRLATQYPLWGTGYTGTVTLYSADVIGNLRERLFILFGAVSFVLLIACVNVANLLLARGAARSREMAVRAALGATRRRLIAQLLTETGVLWAGAALAGVALAYVLVTTVVAGSPPGVPRIEQTRVDGVVLVYALVVSGLCSLAIGLLPALRATNPALEASLREGSRGVGQSKGREQLRAMLVTAEVALAMALSTGAGLLIRSAWEINHLDPAFDANQVLTAQVVLPTTRYGDIATAVQTYRAIRGELDRTPGILSSALAATLPLTVGARAGIGAEGRPTIDGERLIAQVRPVTPNYFATMKVRLIGGRDFAQTDDASAPNVAIINETLAKRFWPGQDAIGKRLEGMDPSHQHFMTVIAVVADPRNVALDQPPDPEFYIPFDQAPPALWSGIQGSFNVVARTIPDPATMDHAIRQAVDAIDPSLPVANVVTMNALVRTSTATARFNTILLSILAGIALLLASVGVYGVVTYAVSQRTREIGLRMALGATPTAIGVLVARSAIVPTLVGAGIGILLSVLTTGVLRDQLYGVAPRDPGTLATIVGVLVAVSLCASYIPARRAMRLSAVKALAT
jgi:putative ABC transport system permease protein